MSESKPTPDQELVGIFVGAAVFATTFLVWASGSLAALAATGVPPRVSAAQLLEVMVRLAQRPAEPAAAWPQDALAGVSGPAFWTIFAVLTVALAVATTRVRRVVHSRRRLITTRDGRAARDHAQWARRRDVRRLIVRQPSPRRLTLGYLKRRDVVLGERIDRLRLARPFGQLAAQALSRFDRPPGPLLAAEERHSVIVFGPTGSLKTTGFVVPSVLEWPGPVLATSVKGDLVADTVTHRRRLGEVCVYDPTGVTGMGDSTWSPLTAAVEWADARRSATWLVEAELHAQGNEGGGDNAFWYTLAQQVIGPLLFAAANHGYTMSHVLGWIHNPDDELPATLLKQLGVQAAYDAAKGVYRADPKVRSSAFSVASSALQAYGDPRVGASSVPVAGRTHLSPGWLLNGGWNTAFLCAPAHEQARLRPLFATLVQQVINEVAEQSARLGGRPIDPPLLLMLDEAANIAPLPELPGLVSTARGLGIQIVSIYQDKGQLDQQHGALATTITNNHMATVVLSGVSDDSTLNYVSGLIGETELRQRTASYDMGRSRATSEASQFRPLAPQASIRQIPPGSGVVIYGSLPPVRIRLRPWFADRGLRQLVRGQGPLPAVVPLGLPVPQMPGGAPLKEVAAPALGDGFGASAGLAARPQHPAAAARATMSAREPSWKVPAPTSASRPRQSPPSPGLPPDTASRRRRQDS